MSIERLRANLKGEMSTVELRKCNDNNNNTEMKENGEQLTKGVTSSTNSSRAAEIKGKALIMKNPIQMRNN